ncbi:MAG: hypothetical protein ACR2MO_04705 [Acidimicrobiales bacterium]
MSTAVDVLDGAPGEVEVRTSFVPAPTLPASMVPATSTAPTVREEQFGGGCMGIPNAYSGSRAESEVNKKPFALIKLGHKLCGFVR